MKKKVDRRDWTRYDYLKEDMLMKLLATGIVVVVILAGMGIEHLYNYIKR